MEILGPLECSSKTFIPACRLQRWTKLCEGYLTTYDPTVDACVRDFQLSHTILLTKLYKTVAVSNSSVI